MLLAIDDVQWLDAGSLEALTIRAAGGSRAGPLSLLLAARCTDAPADPLTVGDAATAARLA